MPRALATSGSKRSRNRNCSRRRHHRGQCTEARKMARPAAQNMAIHHSTCGMMGQQPCHAVTPMWSCRLFWVTR